MVGDNAPIGVEDAGLEDRMEDLAGEQLITRFADERLDERVLPRTTPAGGQPSIAVCCGDPVAMS
jgi:hypothetical protein